MSQYSEEPIVDVEKRTKEIGQILGDPTLFPVEFLNWLKRYLEQSGMQLPLSSIIGGFQPGGGSVRNLAAGLFILYGGPSSPPGSVPCHGQALARTEYALLFSAIGHTWGSPPDSATFLAPDARDRGLFGAGGVLSVGQTDGVAYGSRSGWRHRHSFVHPTVNAHSHGGGAHGHGTHGGNEGFNPSGSGGLQPTGGGDRSTGIVGVDSIGAFLTLEAPGTSGGKVGPDGTNLDGPNFAGVLVAITTGQ